MQAGQCSGHFAGDGLTLVSGAYCISCDNVYNTVLPVTPRWVPNRRLPLATCLQRSALKSKTVAGVEG